MLTTLFWSSIETHCDQLDMALGSWLGDTYIRRPPAISAERRLTGAWTYAIFLWLEIENVGLLFKVIPFTIRNVGG